MYRAGIEWILGVRLRGTRLYLDPCIPRAWPGFEITFRYHSSRYEIVVENPHKVARGVSALLKSMAHRSQPARLSSSPMTAQRTMYALSLDQRAPRSRSKLRYPCDGESKQLLAQATCKIARALKDSQPVTASRGGDLVGAEGKGQNHVEEYQKIIKEWHDNG